MANDQITLACRNYDRTQAIIRGLVKIPGTDLRVFEMSDVVRMFTGLLKGEYGVSEMSLAEVVYYTSRGENDFIAIPVFPFRTFRHSFLFYNTSAAIRSPQDLDGKRIGFPRLVQTASVWMRGMLVDEYKISAQRTRWYVTSLHHLAEDQPKEAIQSPDGSKTQWLKRNGKGEHETLESALLEGELDALGSTQTPSAFTQGDKRIKRLFENYQEEEVAYFRKTNIFPIMHVLALRRSTVESHPELPRELFQLFSRSRAWADAELKKDPGSRSTWKTHDIQPHRDILRGDLWTNGLKRNAHVINKFLSYCYELGVCERAMSPQELFHPSTWELEEAEE